MNRAKRVFLTAGLVVAVCGASAVLGGCNTMSGIGYDIESLGKGLRGGAEETRSGLNSAVGVDERPVYTPTQSELASRRY